MMEEIQVTVPLSYLEKLIRESERAKGLIEDVRVLAERVDVLWDAMVELKEIVLQKPEKTKKPVEVRDMGKVHALMQAKWTQKDIAEEMKISVSTLNRWLLEEKEAAENE